METKNMVGDENGKKKAVGVTKDMIEDVFRENSHLFTPKKMIDTVEEQEWEDDMLKK